MASGLESLGGTLTGDQLLTEMEKLQREREAQLAAASQQAAQGAGQAQEAYQQAAAAPAPELAPGDLFAQTLLGNLASVISQNPQYQQNAQQERQASQSQLIKARQDNLTSLRDVYTQKVKQAEEAADLESTEKYRNKIESITKNIDDLRAKHGNALALEESKHRNRMEEIAARGATGGGGMGGGGLVDPKAIYEGIKRGDIAPEGTNLGRGGTWAAVQSLAAKDQFPLAKQQQTWRALTRHYASQNGTIQLRLRQAAENASGSLQAAREFSDSLQGLVPRGRVTALNRATLAAVRNGAFGNEAAAAAQQLEGQIVALQSELANVYQGGGVPTDHAREMAEAIINVNMSPARLNAAMNLAERDINIRKNAIDQVQAMTPVQGAMGPIAPAPSETTDQVKIRVKNPKGKVFVIDQSELKDAIAHGWSRVK